MDINSLCTGQKILVLRYGTDLEKDCITKHKELIETKGYCWFGKIGIPPAMNSYVPVREEKRPTIVLYNRKGSFLCEFLDISYKRPVEGYPSYYKEKLFAKQVFPRCYLKLGSMSAISVDDLSKLYVVSSGNKVLDTLNKSMSSFLFASYGELSKEEADRIAKKKKMISNDKRPALPINDCLYRQEGICTLKSCISYQYECERPSTCMKQRR